MAQIGVQVIAAQATTPPTPPWNTGNAFMVGFADWGPVGTAIAVQSAANLQVAIGPRNAATATQGNSSLYDAADIFMRENGTSTAAAFLSRVVGPSASAATATLVDGNGSATLLVAADNVGAYGNQLQVVITNSGGSYTLALKDTYGNLLGATSTALTTRAAATTWAAGTGYITITPYVGATFPATNTGVQLAGGTDNRSAVVLGTSTSTAPGSWYSAINAFSLSLGPGQLSAPGQTNTTLPGIWSALAAAALGNNRVAVGDMDDDITAITAVNDLASTFNTIPPSAIGFWAGNLSAPGLTPGTTRNIPPSAVVSAFCARVDATGNPNLPAAGTGFNTVYCTGPWSVVSGTASTYSDADLATLNGAGINGFRNVFGDYENYGFVSSTLPTSDVIFWQYNHLRLKMAITAIFYQVAEPFVFGQLDGQGSLLLAFNTALSGGLNPLYTAGALFGATPAEAYSVDTGPNVNPPNSIQNGLLQALVGVRMSPFAQQVIITLTSFPITQTINV